MRSSPQLTNTSANNTDEEAILDTVDRLFYERGFQAVSMDQVRDASGIPLKRIYARYPSKAHLVEAYLARRDEQWRDRVERYVTSRSNDPRTRLLLVFDALEAFVTRTALFRGCAFHNAFGELGGTSEYASSVVKAHKRHLREFLARTARAAGLSHPKDVAAQLMVLVEGALITSSIEGSARPTRAAKAAAEAVLAAATTTRR